jgi:hypothetical protein
VKKEEPKKEEKKDSTPTGGDQDKLLAEKDARIKYVLVIYSELPACIVFPSQSLGN